MKTSTTEARNARSADLDMMSSAELVTLMNEEDQAVPRAVAGALPQIAQVVDAVAEAFGCGGRLIYVGAGTSGRIGALDAAECPPTFGTDPGQVIALLAGGARAMWEAAEWAEDSAAGGAADLAAVGPTDRDVVVGIAASGRTPYVIGALDHARVVGATTVSLACNPDSEISAHADIAIEVDNGPEVLTGSTRLKAATSQKLILNMISTAAMVRSGKSFGNLMVDVRPTNEKLVDRAARIVMAATGCDAAQAAAALRESNDNAKTAIVALLNGTDAAHARAALDRSHGFVRGALSQDVPASATRNQKKES